jgi:hypothetical protein
MRAARLTCSPLRPLHQREIDDVIPQDAGADARQPEEQPVGVLVRNVSACHTRASGSDSSSARPVIVAAPFKS